MSRDACEAGDIFPDCASATPCPLSVPRKACDLSAKGELLLFGYQPDPESQLTF
jgi:hypothetical protein